MSAHLARAVDAAIAIELADGRHAAARALATHYRETLPALRAAQIAHPLFQVALDWSRLPRLVGAIDRLNAILAAASIAPLDARAPTLAALHARMHYGALPMLYGYPADLAYIDARGLDPQVAIDRYLAAPIVHELCHLAPDREVQLPLHLDECVGGWLGCHVHPAFAYPGPDDVDAIYAAPWLAQVGQAIVRAFGLRAVVRTHAGVEQALPTAFVAAAHALAERDWRARRSLHLLADPMDPEPWLALVEPYLDAPLASDATIVEAALRAMCLTADIVDGSWRTRSCVPREPIVIRDRRVRCGAASYWIPLDVRYEARLAALDEIPRHTAAIMALMPSAAAGTQNAR